MQPKQPVPTPRRRQMVGRTLSYTRWRAISCCRGRSRARSCPHNHWESREFRLICLARCLKNPDDGQSGSQFAVPSAGRAVVKSDFAAWLKNNSTGDASLAELKQLAETHRAEWPYHSNWMTDYVRVVLNAHDPNEDTLLISLERYFLSWRKTGDGWRPWSAESNLLAAGFIVAIIITFALFYTDLIQHLAFPECARPDYPPVRLHHHCGDPRRDYRPGMDGQRG
jgi:hypothetical protein